MAQAPGPLTPVSVPWVDPDGKPALSFRQYFLTLDAAVRAMVAIVNLRFGANAPTLTHVTPPTNANAATAGVPVGGFYTDNTVNPSVVYIRTA